MSFIVDFLKSERDQYHPLVKSFLGDQKKRYAKLTPEYALLLDHLESYLLRGGKWHRPTLGLLAYQIFGGTDDQQARRALISLEVLHRYLLIHDDIMDQDYTRHGDRTVEKIYHDRFCRKYPHKLEGMYSKGNAIVAGDIVHSMTYELLAQSGFKDSFIVAAMRAMNQLMMETGAGWQAQTEQNFQEIAVVTEEAFFTGMQLVSAQYSVVWPLRIGQILAGRLTAEDWDPTIDTFGSHVGAAFQIADDYLGMFGDEKTTGKPVGHDYREGKKTFLILRAYRNGSAEDRKFLDETLGTDVTEAQVKRAQEIMISTGAVEYIKSEAQEHADAAKAALKLIKTNNPIALNYLSELADFLANRSI